MRLRPPMIAYTSSMIAAVFVVVPLWSGSAATVTTAKPGGSTCTVSSPHRKSGCKPTLPVADRTVLPAQSSHHMTRHRYKAAQHQSRPAQQYYQPARQYYQWQEH
jgi:hypothetical protein